MDYSSTNAAEMSAALASGEVSARELAQASVDQIKALNPELNCIITTTEEQAFSQADAADARRAAGTPASALDGVPLVHKDLFCTEGVLTSCGSKMLANFVSPYDATVVTRCREAGLVMVGKANMDEFAMGSSNEHSYFGPARNPWDLDRVPGGSSGGSAVAVASGMAPLATGTDTGGSIRQPAAFCGLTGVKPTYGRVSRHGMVAFASSLDQGGAFARDAADAAGLLSVMAGHDVRDSTSANRPTDDLKASLNESVAGLRVGIARQHFNDGLDGEVADGVRGCADKLADLGAKIVEVDLTKADIIVAAYYVIALAEASSNLSRYDGVRFGYRSPNAESLEELYERSRSEAFGNEVKRRIMLGTYALSAGYYDAYYRKAQQLRRLVRDDYARVFESIDLLLSPATPTQAFRLGENLADPVEMYLADVYTCGINLAGLPAVAFPVGHANGLPLGAQFIAPPFQEHAALSAVHTYQNVTDWHNAQPDLAPGMPGA